MKKSISAGVSIAAALALTVGGLTPSSADAGDYCWTKVDTGERTCYSSSQARDDALAEAGVIAPGVSQAARSAIVSPTASFIFARIYENQAYGGANEVLSATGTSCTSTTPAGRVLSSAWKNRISSIKVYGGCTVKLWEGANFTGASLGWIGSMSYVGAAMNDKTQSIQYKKSA